MSNPTFTSESARASWCIYEWNRDGNDGHFLRLLDQVTDDAGHTRFIWVADYPRIRPGNGGNPLQPPQLYHPRCVDLARSADSDFALLRWIPNTADPYRPRVLLPPYGIHSQAAPLYEIIDCPNVDNDTGLRSALARGVPYHGQPTDRILLLFAETSGTLEAALLERKDLSISNNTLRLAKTAPWCVPQITLQNDDIRRLPTGHGNLSDRLVYIKPTLPSAMRKVVIRPFSAYAHDYVQWFFRTQTALAKSTTTDDMVALLQLLLESPDTLEEFLGTPPPFRDLSHFHQAIKACIEPAKQQASGFIYELLKRDSKLMAEFKRQARRDIAKVTEQEVERRTKHLEDLDRQCASKEQALHKLEQQESQASGQLVRRRQELEEAKRALAQQEERQREALQQLEENVALKLGLRALAKQTAATTAASPASSSQCTPLAAKMTARTGQDLTSAIAHNLRVLGMASTDATGDAYRQQTEAMASHLRRTLIATRTLCVDGTLASTVANALAYALGGQPAHHTGLAPDWHDTSGLEHLLSSCDAPVVMLDNVFDTVNEPALFALGRRDARTPTVVIPLGSYANIRLAAPEIWNSMFFVPTDGFVALPAGNGVPEHASHSSISAPPISQNVLAQLADLRKRTSLAASALTMPATIMATHAGSPDALQWILPHLCIETCTAHGSEAAHELIDRLHAPALTVQLTALLERIGHGNHLA